MTSVEKHTAFQPCPNIEGIKINVPVKGQCFETNALRETIQVPVDFIKKLGIFQYTKEDGKAYLLAMHLSYIEFCTVASLCRPSVDKKQELSKIEKLERFEAVVIYLVGLFSRNDESQFLTKCRNLGQNFLHLLKNPPGDSGVQIVFHAIHKVCR